MAVQADVSGLWYNQRGSTLELQVTDGSLTGSFTSSVGLSRDGRSAAVVGFVSGDLISFVANFEPHASLTSWSGHVTGAGDGNVMELQWQMTVALPGRGAPSELWRGIWVGADVFRRQPFLLEPAPQNIASHPLPDWP